MAGSNFIIDSYPKDGRLAKYEKELANLEKTNDTDGILSFCKNLFCDCMKYLQSKSYHFPDFYFNLINKKEFNELSDRLDRLLGSIPRHRAMIVGGSLGSPPQI